jgi:hypothetical protein
MNVIKFFKDRDINIGITGYRNEKMITIYDPREIDWFIAKHIK